MGPGSDVKTDAVFSKTFTPGRHGGRPSSGMAQIGERSNFLEESHARLLRTSLIWVL